LNKNEKITVLDNPKQENKKSKANKITKDPKEKVVYNAWSGKQEVVNN
jgi:hypothetical protein